MKKKLAIVLSAIMAIGVLGSAAVVPTATYAEEATKSGFQSPIIHEEKGETEYDYVYFGVYPTKEITGDEITDAIKNAEYNDEGVGEVDGVKYVRMKQSNATANAVGNGSLRGLDYTEEAFYKWEDNRTYHYFKYEPIRWRVLESKDDTLLLMTDQAVDCQRYSSNSEKYTWSDCPMRVWLNGYAFKAANGYTCAGGGFLNTAFTKEQQEDIINSPIHTEANTLWGGNIPGGPDVEDKVFLLSVEDLMNESYGFSQDALTLDADRQVKPTDYAYAMGTWLGTYGEHYGNCWWMLRTSGDYAQKMALVYRTGQVYKEGYYVNTSYYGVVPALRVKASSKYLMTEEEYQEQYGEKLVYGDADGSGKVDLKDATLMLKLALGIEKQEDGALKKLDVDGNGALELKDVTYVLKYALGIIDVFPAENATTKLVTDQVETMKAENEAKLAVAAEEAVSYEKHAPSGKIWIAADSIAAQHDNATNLAASSVTVKTRDTLGWGVIFARYFVGGNYERYEEGKKIETPFAIPNSENKVVVNNTALSSRSSKSFAAEENYNMLASQLGAGDYLLISFGHNDEYPQVERYTDPYGDSTTEGSYKWYLKTKYIDPALEAGATPVLISSVVKRNYVGGAYQPQFHEIYTTAMKELAEEYAAKGVTIPFIDLHHKMDALYKTLSDEESKLLHASYDVAELNDGGNPELVRLLTDGAGDEAAAKEKLKLMTVAEVKALIEQAAQGTNVAGMSFVNKETSGSYMDNVHFTYAGVRYAVKYILEGMKDAGLDLYGLTDADAVKSLEEITPTESFKETELYK